jgi:ATP-dependent Clp protease ATP-binding subunit ClpB
MDGIVEIRKRRPQKGWRTSWIWIRARNSGWAMKVADLVYGASAEVGDPERCGRCRIRWPMLAGDVEEGETGSPVSAGVDGLLIGDRACRYNRPKPDEATVH